MAIGYLHAQGIAHRDLKLENILLSQDGYLRIIDYGLAKMIGEGKDRCFNFYCRRLSYQFLRNA
jgi:serine/threonine protein kinase